MNAHRTLAPLFVALALAGGCATVEPDDASYGAFRDSLDRETFPGGVWIFDGDLPVESEKRLQEVWTVRGLPGIGTWGPVERRELRYCVSDAFGADHARVTEALAAAAETWEGAADVDFQHVAEEDGACDATNDAVVFDVRPVWGQPYMARAFFPSTGRAHRNLLVSLDALGADAPPLTKLFEHQLGHALGIDHTRIGTALVLCDEEEHGAGLMGASLECAGADPHDMTDSELARVRQLYGPPGLAERPASRSERRTFRHDGLLGAGMSSTLVPFGVEEGSHLSVQLEGSHDLDLYVRFDQRPTAQAWDCRPFGPDATERCSLEVPAGARYAFVMVRSAAETSEETLALDDFAVTVEHVVPEMSDQQVPRIELTYDGR